MTCKDCIHYDVCGGYTPTDLDRDVFHYAREGRADEIPGIEERCSGFKDKSRFVELPCKVGDKVYKITRNKVKECEVVFVGLSADERCSHFNFVENYEDGTFYKSYSMVFDVLGKSVFITKEEAIKKLGEK